MRRMLDPKEVEGGSLPSTVKFDEEGNRTVGKNLGVDGKLILKSLVSESNPDGDITKELGGSTTPARHGYSVFVQGRFHYDVYTTKDYGWQIGKYNYIGGFASDDNYKELRYVGNYPASGFWKDTSGSKNEVIFRFQIDTNNYLIFGYDVLSGTSVTEGLSSTGLDIVYIIQLF